LTPRDIRDANREEELLALTPERYRMDVLEGRLEVLEGQNPNKPVIRVSCDLFYVDGKDYKRGQTVPGTGRYPNANDIAVIGKETAYKLSKSYREAIETLTPIDGGPEVKGSVAWWFDQAWQAASGSPQLVTCTSCGHKWNHAFKKDGGLIFKMIELVGGKAKETKDINVRDIEMKALLEKREVDVYLHEIDPNEAASRRRLLKVIEGEIIDEATPPSDG